MPESGKNNDPKEGRRNFLKIFGGAVAGAALGIEGNKYFERRQELNKLHELFNGKEDSFYYANKAAGYLLNEMEVENISRVRLSSTGHPNERIEILRDFLTKHLNSSAGKKYHQLRDDILKEGFYVKDSLIVLMQASQEIDAKERKKILEKHHEDILRNERGDGSKSDKSF